jgi:hypothetical protein
MDNPPSRLIYACAKAIDLTVDPDYKKNGPLGIPGMPTISCDPDVGHFDHESYVSRHQALWRKSKLIGRQPVSCELGFLLYDSY